ncbi:AAA family ATPase [Streptomyces griseus]|uniref:AAA family ATPase n=1 Tax=Streptomyces griseus TaxID=1911 RepID=UPI00378F64D9
MTTSYDPSALPPDDVLTAGLADMPPLDWADGPPEQPGPARKLRLTRASDIEPEPVEWAWLDNGDGRVPAGALSIAAGREGTGKSSFGMWMAAQITRGQLPGTYSGSPRVVFYVAVEDSWKQTIVPRLIGAGANLDLVYRVEAVEAEYGETTLSLPQDNSLMEQAIKDYSVALVVLDPLMSCIGAGIDTHRERDVRTALDPLARMADRTGCVLLGIAHFGKGAGTDPSALITGSGAFKNVPRAVFGFARDDDNECRVMSQSKNSLGRADLPSLSYNIETTEVPTKKGIASVGRFAFTGESSRSVQEILAQGQETDRGERDEAADWLRGYLLDHGGEAPSKDVKKAAAADDISERTLQRAMRKAGVKSERAGFGKGAVWRIEALTTTTESDSGTAVPPQSRQSRQASEAGVNGATDGATGVTDEPTSQNVTAPEVLCTVCRSPLDPVHAATGETTHPTC